MLEESIYFSKFTVIVPFISPLAINPGKPRYWWVAAPP